MGATRRVRNLAFAGSLLLLTACSSPKSSSAPGAQAWSRESTGPVATRTPPVSAVSAVSTVPRPWYADRLEKLGFVVFPAHVDVGDFSTESLDEGSSKLSASRGKIVLLNFWATWCPPSGSLGSAFNASAIPTTYLIDKTGKAIAGTRGAQEYASPEFLSIVSQLASQ